MERLNDPREGARCGCVADLALMVLDDGNRSLVGEADGTVFWFAHGQLLHGCRPTLA